jgi:membrane-bound lytic murein transglycosylase F
MFKLKKIKTMQFLAKNTIIFILIFGLYACTKEPANTPLSFYCSTISEKLYSFSRLSDFEKMKFDELKKSRFLKHKNHFIEAAQTFDIEWELLAAVAFQESQWDPKARSATQVKGMLMLTLPTAASVGVTNRLDPIQSIYGGAQYIADLKLSTNYGTSSGDKTAFILASYNLGTTNIKNAIDAIDKKPIEVTWLDLERYLLKLKTSMDSENYSRGQQTVDFVERVRDYYYLLLAQNCSDN